MTDPLKRKMKDISKGVDVPDMDVSAVMALSHKRRRIQRLGTVFLTVVLISVGWAIGVQINFGPAPDPDPRGDNSEHEIVFSAPSGTSAGAGETDIFVASKDGSRVENLTQTAGTDTYPVWSPDGSRIAFVSERFEPGNVDIYVMNADGSDVSRLTDDRAIDTQPTWSPDGTEIAFSRSEGGSADIYAVNVADSTVQQITDGDALDEEPAWAPGGNEIAFASYVEGNQEIFTVHPDGMGMRRLTTLEGSDWDPSWSPDGNRLVFSRDPDESDSDRGDLYVLDTESGNIEQLTSSPAIDKSPDWSSTDTSIIFVREYQEGTRTLLTIDVSASDVEELQVPMESPSLPDWKG
jgi:Tol biopolymer transport system component